MESRSLIRPLYRSLRRLRYILPVTAFLLVVVHQTLAHTWLQSLPRFQHFLWQVLLYGTVGPLLIWLALGWLARWIREQDEAGAYLHTLYQMSRRAAAASEMDQLVEIALSMPEQVLAPVATSLIWREQTEAPWTLAGTRHLKADEQRALESHLGQTGSDLRCSKCLALTATARQNCPLRSHLPQEGLRPADTSVICLPLSTERPPLALLNVYLFDDTHLSPTKRRVLETMAAVLSVSLDHARLRAREFHMLNRMEQTIRQQKGISLALEHILADIATAQRAEAGEVFLVSKSQESPDLTPVASWPESGACAELAPLAQQALRAGKPVTANGSMQGNHRIAIPLKAEGLTTGVLVLSGRQPLTAPQMAFLRVAAGMMALIVRNSQLYARLESQAVLEERHRLAREVHDGLAQSLGFLNFKVQQVDRLLGRQQWEAARQALKEMRDGVQELYTEVRLTIQDLRWPPEDDRGLVEHLRQYVPAFAARAGLDVSLSVEGEPDLSLQQETHLFRVVQEALTNVHKHAQAQHIWVRLRTDSTGVTLEVEDDGKGLPSASPDAPLPGDPEHFGLRIMRERAEAIGGRLSVHSLPGRGVRLRVTVPVSSAGLQPPASGPQPPATSNPGW